MIVPASALLIAAMPIPPATTPPPPAISDTSSISDTTTLSAPVALDGPAWITAADYPPEARRRGMAGTVAVLLEVDVEGMVNRCTITRSSGHALLDATTCRLLRERAHYRLQRDEHSKPLPFVVRTGMDWRLPAANAPGAQDAAAPR